MRPARSAAALLAALVLAAAGCDLVSSLTPFGLGTRSADEDQVAFTGSWEGSTDGGGKVTFSVSNGLVGKATLEHVEFENGQPVCIITFIQGEEVPILDGTFTLEAENLQGSFVLEGRFASPDASAGTYSFRSLPASQVCPTSGSGSYTAGKLPPANP